MNAQRGTALGFTPATAAAGQPTGGAAGQVLSKIDGTNYNSQWIDNFATDVRVAVKNSTGATLSKGTVVYISGANGDNILVSKALANAESTSSKTFGIVFADIANDTIGNVVCEGALSGIDTSAATAGDPVWLSPTTAGGMVFGLANKPVAPNNTVYLGVVSRVQANNGVIQVKIQNGYELDELHDILITSKATNDFLVLASDGLWKNRALASGDVTTALGFTPFSSAGGSMSGNLQVNGTVSATQFNGSAAGLTGIKTVNGSSILGSGNLTIDALPSQTGNSGKFLTTNGTAASWSSLGITSGTPTASGLLYGKTDTGVYSAPQEIDYGTGTAKISIGASTSTISGDSYDSGSVAVSIYNAIGDGTLQIGQNLKIVVEVPNPGNDESGSGVYNLIDLGAITAMSRSLEYGTHYYSISVTNPNGFDGTGATWRPVYHIYGFYVKTFVIGGTVAENVFLGLNAGAGVTTGGENVVLGVNAGGNIAKGRNNVVIGNAATASAYDVNNEVTLGNSLHTKTRLFGALALGGSSVGTAGQVLTSQGPGVDPIWAAGGSSLPTQTGNSGKFLTTDGTNASWATVDLSSYLTTSAAASTYLPLVGGTLTGKLTLPASTSTAAGLNIGNGAAPTTPVAGDVWGTSSTLMYRGPTSTYTVAFLSTNQTWTGAQTFSTAATVSGTLTGSSTISLTGSTTSTTSLGTSATSGTLNLGGTSQTGLIRLGQSTVSQTISLHGGVTSTGNTKTLNLGTGGDSGSTTNIAIGSATAGATTNVTASGNWTFGSTITGSISGNAANVTGTVAIANGGTGAADAATARTNLGLAIGTNVQAWDADLDAIAALAGTSGFLKKTAANTWALDTNTYLTGNQSITVSGDASGSGTTSIALTLANSGVTAGTYTKITVDAKGRATSGTSLASSDVTTALGYTPYNSTNPNGYITSSGSISGNAATATALQTARTINGTGFNGSANIDTTEWFHSDRDFPNGTLITTNINYAVSSGDPFVLEIRGNSYGNAVPLDLLYQGYIYSDTIINHGGVSNGFSISGLVAINNGGNLCFWFPNQGYWNGYNVKVYAAYATRATNRVTSITGVAKPTTAKEVALSANIRQSLHSSNFTNYSPSLTGSGASGTWGINISGISTATSGVTAGSYTNATVTVDAYGRVTSASSGSSGGGSYVGGNAQLFTSSGTFTVPAGITKLKITAFGGGGGGSSNNGGLGGAGVALVTVTAGASYTVTIGSGGNGAAYTNAGATAGGTTSFGSLVTATGGGAGNATSGTFSTTGTLIGSMKGNTTNLYLHGGSTATATGSIGGGGGGMSGGGSSGAALNSTYVGTSIMGSAGVYSNPSGGAGGGSNGGAGGTGYFDGYTSYSGRGGGGGGGMLIEW